MAFATFESSGKMPSLNIDLAALGSGLGDTLLLGETAHCYLVAVSETNAAKLQSENSAEFPVVKLGEIATGAGKLVLGKTEIPLKELYSSWAGGLKEYFR
jgi:hypothetical protein